jgi:hypothetical protein
MRTQGEDMSTVTDTAAPVTGGVDTHAQVNVAAVVAQVGRVLGTKQLPTTTVGHRAALAWLRSHGRSGITAAQREIPAKINEVPEVTQLLAGADVRCRRRPREGSPTP